MNKYARILNERVAEIITLPDTILPEDLFSNEIPGYWLAIGDDVGVNYTYNGETFSPPKINEIDLDLLKQNIIHVLNQEAENERLKYITAGSGQALVYQEKLAQAEAFLSAYETNSSADADANDYPLLTASLNIDGDSLLKVAQAIYEKHKTWLEIAALIEETRLKAKAAIKAAETLAIAQSVLDTLSWPSIKNISND